MKISFPCINTKLVPAYKVIANDYNPNVVATPEMKLLKTSIELDGVTMPVVTYYNPDKDRYIVVDGFHRYTILKKHLKSDMIPVSVIDKPLEERMASTIRHNRARGTHQIRGMSDIVLELSSVYKWSDEKICNQLGMDLDEVIRLKQITGLKKAFANHQFSKSWEEYEKKREAKNHE
ncbi:MAG: ParB/RepB/Spo0J family partition protein [Halanaerobiales bacterium]|nr:ParB/RepB/Spo0J family partition protein [Halanaerobiales bacterium]